MEKGPVEPERPTTTSGSLLGRDEMNFAEFPLALLTDRVPSDLKTLEVEDRIYDERKKHFVHRRLTITASDKYGLPTPKDEDVLLALIQLTKQTNQCTDRRVSFSRAELLKLLDWPRTGPSYERVLLALCRWSTVFFFYENSWWENRRQSFESRGFNILDNFELNDGRQAPELGGRIEAPNSRFSWNEIVFGSFEAGYLKRLDFAFYLGLKHAVSKRMYRFLDKRFHHSSTLKFALDPFAFEKIGLSRGYSDSGKIKEKLRPALDELTTAGFLEPMSRGERYTRLGRGAWSITFIRRVPKAEPGPRPPAPSPLEADLIRRGVTPTTAAELVVASVEEHIRARIEVFDWLVAKKDRRISKSPAGYLVDSIRKGYAAPKGFESQADRARRLAAEEAQQRPVAEAQRRAEAEQQAREEADQARMTAYWDSLSPEAQEQLRAEAIAQADALFAGPYRQHQHSNSERAEFWLKIILANHISKLLDGQGP